MGKCHPYIGKKHGRETAFKTHMSDTSDRWGMTIINVFKNKENYAERRKKKVWGQCLKIESINKIEIIIELKVDILEEKCTTDVKTFSLSSCLPVSFFSILHKGK